MAPPTPSAQWRKGPTWPGFASLLQRFCGTKAHDMTTKDVGPNGSPTWGPSSQPSGAYHSQLETKASRGTESSIQVALSPWEE